MSFTTRVKSWAEKGYTAAIDCDGRSLTYSEMDSASDAIAVYLHRHLPENSPVILWGDKENQCLTCMLAAIKAGHPYVFVPSWFPEEKLHAIVEASGACLVISMQESVPHISVSTLNIDGLEKAVNAGGTPDPRWETKEEETACIFFTSGSTGKPKGVLIPMSAVEDMEHWWTEMMYRGIENPRILNFSSYAFTASLQTVYSFMIGFGGCLYAVDRNTTKDFHKMLQMIMDVKPNYLDCTPSFVDLCMQDERFGSDGLPEMAVISVGGEPLNERIADRILHRFYKADLVNGYGATEMTSGPIACVITPEMVDGGGSMPIGYVAEGSLAYVVDEEGKKLPFGRQGEMIVVSKMISKGYLNDREKNEKVFFTAENGLRGYHTGDLVRIKEDGLILYDGRVNNMVKIGGYRVEMEEIELRLNQIPGVIDSIVVPVYRDTQAVMTSAYVIMEEGQKKGLPGFARIKKALQAELPAYMVPQKINFVEEFPKNSNGKNDRKKLIEDSRIQ